jgi:acyl carrier protein
MAAELSNRDQSHLRHQGWEPIALEQGLRVLEALLGQDTPQVGVLPVNWSKFVEHFFQRVECPLLKNIVQASGLPVAPQPTVLQQLETTPVNARRAMLMAYLRTQVATVLGMGSSEQIESRQRLFDLGIDSLMALQLKNRLEPSLGCTLSQTLLFDYPTIEALTDYLVQEVIPLDFSWKSEVEQQPENKAPELCPANLEQLSESEVEALLLKELEKMNH